MAMVASSSNPPTNTDSNSINNINDGGQESGPEVCLLKLAADAASGAVMGSIFGLGSGLIQRKGFKNSLAEGGSSAKTFAILSGVHSFVNCCLKKLRGKDDAINAGISGCVTGLALSVPGSPQALLQGCVTFGAFSYVLEAFHKHQEANALPLSRTLRESQNSPQIAFPVLPPFTLPFPFFKSISALQPAEPHTASKNQNHK